MSAIWMRVPRGIKLLGTFPLLNSLGLNAATARYPPSERLGNIEWHWETHRTSAPGSDLWPVTWASDNNLYTAWGDGGGFGGTDRDGRVALGFGRIAGAAEEFKGINVNGGKHG